jgi:hypothetical protein
LGNIEEDYFVFMQDWEQAKALDQSGNIRLAEDLIFDLCQQFPAASDSDYTRKFDLLLHSEEIRKLIALVSHLPERLRPSPGTNNIDVLVWAHRIGSEFVRRRIAR